MSSRRSEIRNKMRTMHKTRNSPTPTETVRISVVLSSAGTFAAST